MMSARAFVITGHRGAMAVAPENTLASFRTAVEMGADELELDVQLTRDGELVVMHDETLDRTTNGTGAVADHSWREISGLVAGGAEPVMRLADVVRELPTVGLQIEVKAPAAASGVLALVEADEAVRSRVLLASFHADVMAFARSRGTNVRIGLICCSLDERKLRESVGLGVDQLLLHWDLAEHPVIAEYRERGTLISIWPCNDAASVRRAIEQGYVGTTCDDPSVGVAVRRSLERETAAYDAAATEVSAADSYVDA